MKEVQENRGMKSVLFICRGNTCRSPIAEAIFKQLLLELDISDDWYVDSAGTAAHVGESPNPRGQTVLKGVGMYHFVQDHKARQVTADDCIRFDYMLCMDHSNINDVKCISGSQGTAAKTHLKMLGSYDEHDGVTSINDPITGGLEDYKLTYEQCLYFCKNFLHSVMGRD